MKFPNRIAVNYESEAEQQTILNPEHQDPQFYNQQKLLEDDFYLSDIDERTVSEVEGANWCFSAANKPYQCHQLKGRLADWIVPRRIKLVDADELLSFFRDESEGEDFTKTARSFIHTPRIVHEGKLSNGENHNLGLKINKREMLEETPISQDEAANRN